MDSILIIYRISISGGYDNYTVESGKAYFHFGESLIQWIKVMYTKHRYKIVNNGYFSESIELLRGVNQGCPLSPYLFIMAIEMLDITIRSNKNIKKLEIQEIKEKCQCMPMTQVFSYFLNLDPCTVSLKITFLASGLKPYYDKCTILRIGSLKICVYTTL
jgi:hypothetical protein